MNIACIIQWIKENEWLFWILASLGGIAAILGYLGNQTKRMRELNRVIYNNTLKSRFSDLFEFEPQKGFSIEQLDTGGYEIGEIIGFCWRVTEFRKKKNHFRGVFVKLRFSLLYCIVKKIYKVTDESHFTLAIAHDPNRKYMEIYRNNPKRFFRLKKRFRKLYLSIFDSIEIKE